MSHFEFTVQTPSREALVDITSLVEQVVGKAEQTQAGAAEAALVFVPHTTAGVTVNEGADPSVAQDILETLARLVPREARYRHGEGNSDAHVKTALLGNDLLIPIRDGRLRLGTWQSIYLAEFDGPRTRRVWVTLLRNS